MNDKNDKGKKRTARERLAEEREHLKAREKRRRTLLVGAAVVCIMGLAAAVGVLAANAGGDKSDSAGPVIPPKGAVGKGGLAIPVGQQSAKSTLTVWEDFRCPACKQFETTFRPTLHELTGSGQLKTEYHLVTLIDDNAGGSGSLHAANAAACAQEAGKFSPYHDVLYENQPAETEDGYADNATLLRLADKVSGLNTPAFRKCVDDGTHNSWVAKSNDAFQDSTFQGTPTILLNGKNVFGNPSNPLTPQKLKQMVQAADR
ncbi:thioredoxin domain-containing protein [Streptomyces sp. TS71-3]|uniref:DsbA family protein n=1 Tax=Streptomyces sp. TS71-3 TaxID=2733862 RepID=UPI001B1DBDD9|nr:thioredoxin domain-containing protein [Streptomyces sp. TS71-3]GHJ38270.1 membrane protein [Streptomyces sp. TS71-3]